MSLADKIREARKRKDLTQSALAQRLGVHKSEVSHYECGKRIPRTRCLNDIARILDISVSTLLESNHKIEHGLIWGEVDSAIGTTLIPKYFLSDEEHEKNMQPMGAIQTECFNLGIGLYIWVASNSANLETLRIPKSVRLLFRLEPKTTLKDEILLICINGKGHGLGEFRSDLEKPVIRYTRGGQQVTIDIQSVSVLGHMVQLSLDL
jgi:transcriptional regulator with XRE-family HTH domain